MFSPLFGFYGKIMIGTSGWNYEDWIGIFYKSSERLFSQYSKVFDTVEINSSFYKPPSPKTLRFLAKIAPEGFIFSLKVYKEITHKKMLNPKLGVEKDINNFLKLLTPLKVAGKLGPILFQLPPYPKNNFPYIDDFLKILDNYSEYKFVIEFRDPSWLTDEVFSVLKDHEVAYCIVDEPLLPPVTPVTTDFAYIRWHGRGERPWYYYLYSEEELKEWVPRIKELSKKVKRIYGYFNNHFRGFAPRNALQMLILLGLATPRQKEKLREIEEYLKNKALLKLKEEYSKREKTTKDMLNLLTTEKRFKRALEIPDNLVKIKYSDEIIQGTVKNYKITIDLKEKIIKHDCPDWEKLTESKRFCKHLVKFFLSMPSDKSKEILKNIIENIEEWSFETI